MATLYIDNVPYEVKDGQNLLHACLSLGFDVPYFCWHPALGSVGACRQCAVKQFKDENDTRGRIVMSCMTPVTDGMRISIDDAEVRAFRARVIEWLMKNHPHDCPICDEGGECHLQDMTVMSGHTARRYRFTKRTHNNQNLGPFLNHEMNRCIQCYRCVRFYREYAGGRDLNAFASHDNVYFGRHEDGTLENEFSGNLAEICPTGVFTDKTFKQHFTRAWDLQVAPSVCVHCGLGCNVIPGERYGEVRRIRNRYNGAVNGYFLCDRGRYGYAFLSAESRIRQVSRKPARSAAEETTAKDAALKLLGRLLRDAKGVIGIGSPRASLESNFALRALAGPDAFFTGLSAYDNRLADAALAAMREGPVPVATLQEVGMADAVFVLGEDLVNTAPLAALRLRQAVRIQPMAISRKLRIPDWDENAVREAVQDARGPLFIASAAGTGLDVLATRTYSAAPDDLARLGFAVAHALDPNAPAVPGLSGDMAALADEIAQALASAKRPLVISGASVGSASVVQAAAQAARALHTRNSAAMLFITAPECNSVGLALLGGGSLEEAQQRIVSGAADTVIVVENDLYRRADKALVDELLDTAKCVVVLDHTLNPTTAKADIVLPAAAFADGDGTLVNNEGRAQRFFQVYMPDGDICESWRWLGEMARAAGRAQDAWSALDGIQSAMAAALPVFEGVLRAAPRADERFAGQRLPRQPHRYSGRTSMRAHLGVSEPGIPNDPDSLFTFSMEGFRGAVPGSVLASTWKPGWNSVQSVTKSQEEAGGSLCGGDPGVRLIEPRE
ncbi:MAG: NADH-quinone oxidoreductase subunit, partial [Candidatus Hydrogenedentes bacterium]|nr:NADH-quinone oxidoreductase subunit [Candidatus Hydrogenedentota bacterium]